MSKEAHPFITETFVRSSRELAKNNLTPDQLQAIVGQISAGERPRLHTLFAGLAENLQPKEGTAAKQQPAAKPRPELPPELRTQLEQAEKLFGEDFMGPAQIETAFGFYPSPEQIPAIPFSPERLDRAQKMGMMLVLHIDKTPDGKPMTMQAMNTMQAESGRNENVLWNTDWYQNEDFHTRDTPRLGWRLESKAVLPDSTDKNEVEQLELIVGSLRNDAFQGMELSADYSEAIAEFESEKAEITQLMESDDKWPEASDRIEALKLSKLTRAIPAEMIQSIETHHQNTDQYMFSNIYVRTTRRFSLGSLVNVGSVRADGARVSGSHAGYRHGSIGVSLSLQS